MIPLLFRPFLEFGVSSLKFSKSGSLIEVGDFSEDQGLGEGLGKVGFGLVDGCGEGVAVGEAGGDGGGQGAAGAVGGGGVDARAAEPGELAVFA